jgi:hypothetical protein
VFIVVKFERRGQVSIILELYITAENVDQGTDLPRNQAAFLKKRGLFAKTKDAPVWIVLHECDKLGAPWRTGFPPAGAANSSG